MRRLAFFTLASFAAAGIAAACSSFSGDAPAPPDASDDAVSDAAPPPVTPPPAAEDSGADVDAGPDAAFFNHLFDSLAGVWNFDEDGGKTAYDSTLTYADNGTLIGAATHTDAGIDKGGLLLPKVDSGSGFVLINPSPELDGVMTTGALSITAWIKLLNPTSDPWIFTMDSLFGVKLNGGHIELFVGQAYAEANDPILVPDTWHHIATTFDQGIVVFYLDGQSTGIYRAFDAGVHVADANASGTGAIHIGVDNVGFNPAFGTLDKVCYWTRALAPEEVKFLYTSK